MTTETKHEELRELHEAATPGPWYTLDPPWLESGETSILAESPDPHVARFICDFDMWQFDPDNEADKISENPDEDARLIVHLRNNVEHYIAQDARIAELEAENARLWKALEASTTAMEKTLVAVDRYNERHQTALVGPSFLTLGKLIATNHAALGEQP